MEQIKRLATLIKEKVLGVIQRIKSALKRD